MEAIKNNKSLVELDLSNNKIGSAENLNTVMPDLVTGVSHFLIYFIGRFSLSYQFNLLDTFAIYIRFICALIYFRNDSIRFAGRGIGGAASSAAVQSAHPQGTT